MPQSKKPRKKRAATTVKKLSSAPVSPARGAAALEALLSSMRQSGSADDALSAAQDIIYEAWDAPTKKQRVALAWKALAVCGDCADAYVLLAQEEAKTLEDARDLYDLGVKAGEKALGPEDFKEFRGHFWGFHETRPYMRARAGLAMTLERLGDVNGAIGHYKELLKLNKNDNQGIRYLLARALMSQDDIAGLKALFKKHKDDASADWLYSRAMVAYRESGESEEATALALEALQSNAHVPGVLAGKTKAKPRNDGYVTMGGADEAAAYAEHWGEAWRSVEGAVAWLLRVAAQQDSSGVTRR